MFLLWPCLHTQRTAILEDMVPAKIIFIHAIGPIVQIELHRQDIDE